MVLLQPKLSLKVAQRQILTPGLMQMVSVLALNKLELKEMIQAEIAENPVLEELEENVPLLDDVARAEEDRDRPVETQPVTEAEAKKKIRSMRSTSDRTSRIISTPDSVRPTITKKSKSRPSRIFSRRRPR